ncbi:MAG TPA: CheR family methyltransferase, partial [Candidatus Manganitrophaceae bacterium]|nr:CheR family methyltransferase [Candidatus Manganitrophaceae bacterium]
MLRRIPGIRLFTETKTWRSFRYGITTRVERRENSTFTGFQRLPTQFEALAGPVIDFLLEEAKPLNVTVHGCSNGAEAYSIASILKNARPALRFAVHAFDIDPKIIEKARSARYERRSEVLNNKYITEEFVETTFDSEDGFYRVKNEVRDQVRFDVADALDRTLREKIGRSDIVYAQNFLFHMKPRGAVNAFNNVCALLKEKSALFIDGMDLPLRQKLTRAHRLTPLEYKIKEIHEEARRARGTGWPYHYWGLEPFTT